MAPRDACARVPGSDYLERLRRVQTTFRGDSSFEFYFKFLVLSQCHEIWLSVLLYCGRVAQTPKYHGREVGGHLPFSTTSYSLSPRRNDSNFYVMEFRCIFLIPIIQTHKSNSSANTSIHVICYLIMQY